MIHFVTEGVEMPAIERGKVETWIRATAAGYGFATGDINYIFCSDERILEVNRQFLGHDYYTDIITFDYSTPTTVSGDIYIGAGESHIFHYISQAIAALRAQYPDIRAHVTSGDTVDLIEQLDNGLLDFALVFTDYDKTLYNAITLPERARFGLLMRRDSPLAVRDTISLKELTAVPLIVSRAFDRSGLGRYADKCDIVATYNLINNAAFMVEDGVGYALGLDRLINVTGESALCFRPFEAEISVAGFLIWKKFEALSPAVQLFLEQLESNV